MNSAFQTCQAIANAVLDNRTFRGVSYNFAKCYDHIPYRLAVSIMRHRGADSSVCRALNGFYAQHFRHFQLEGHYRKPFHVSNGLIQGCCLSNLFLASLVGAWQEFVCQQLPQGIPRSYADDLSITRLLIMSPVKCARMSFKPTTTHVALRISQGDK